MGGWAFMIYGDFDAERAAAAATPPSFLDRLRGRKAPSISSADLGNSRLLQFPADVIQQPLANDYRTFVRTRLDTPTEASQSVLDYLDLGQPTIYIRANQTPAGPAPEWYVQISFSGAAGMAETSARVAAHWAALWYTERSDAIRAILAPVGFNAVRCEELDEPRFVPAGEYGYIEREGGELTADWSVLESEDDPDAVLKMLDERYGALLEDGRCHCQLCESGLKNDIVEK
jgi:hypothetical protein